MNLHIGVILASLGLTLFAGVHGDTVTCDSSNTKALTESINKFAIDIYKEIVKSTSNGTENVEDIFMSPFSIFTALSMLTLGTGSTTKSEMIDALHVKDIPENVFHPTFACLKDYFFEERNAFALKAANKLYKDETLTVKEPFLDELEEYYDGAMEELDFKDTEGSIRTINEWVADQTMHMITNALQTGDIDAMTVLALINAIYFKGNWISKFNQEDTKEHVFYKLHNEAPSKVTMMHQADAFLFTDSPLLKAKILELPYVQEKNDKNAPKLCMNIILPYNKKGLLETESRLTSELLASELSFLHVNPVYVDVPRLKLKARYELSSLLENLGMKELFSSHVDVSPFSDDPRVDLSMAFHQADLDMDERGTSAAAVSVFVGGRSGTPPPVNFTCEHPFIFIIRDITSNTILFMGRVTSPDLQPNINFDEPLDDNGLNGATRKDRRKDCKRDCRKKCQTECKEKLNAKRGFKKIVETLQEYRDCKRQCKSPCFETCRTV